MMSKPEQQHQWLKRFVGEWAFDSECFMGPDKPPAKSSGVEVVRMLGELWMVAEMHSEMPDGGGPMSAIMTVGFDPVRGKFIGTWVGSPMTALFVYEGVMTDSGGVQTLPLNTIGPSWADPTKTTQYQDVIELHGDDRRVLWSQALGDDGQWMRFMTANYRRTK